MSKILGYGEDALTLWLLKNQPTKILEKFNDKLCLAIALSSIAPSFGRSGGSGSTEFGEFDAILTSKQNVYLIESKWDKHRIYNQTKLMLKTEQTKRHEVFKWCLSKWSQNTRMTGVNS